MVFGKWASESGMNGERQWKAVGGQEKVLKRLGVTVGGEKV